MKLLLSAPLLLLAFSLDAQDHSGPFGQVTYKDLDMKTYDKDTSATAVVLYEFGEAYVENDRDGNLIFQYHARIKILKQAGIEQGDIKIPLYKSSTSAESIRTIKASSFTMENGSMKEFKLDPKSIYTLERSKYYDEKRFAIPGIRVGSVIEIQYVLESPFIFNFHNWEFQSEIPKVSSEYWASVQANYRFNISIRGFLELQKNEASIIRDCFTFGTAKADCSQYKWAMKDIPAFKEEDFMTAKSNFLSMIKFELTEVKHFDGRTDKYTKEWKDAEQELRTHEKFGVQLKRGKAIVDEHIAVVVAGETEPLAKAMKIYDFMKDWYRWNEARGKYSELGIKAAFDKKTGNVGDINLSLIAALKYAGIDTEPVLLSTRDNGLPTELHPVLSDFNYVIAKVNIGDKVYLLDATDDFMPFGLLPTRCLNGKGRVLGEKESYWYELKAAEKARYVTILTAKLESNGVIQGSMTTTYFGYEAAEERIKIASAGGAEGYLKELKSSLPNVNIKGIKVDKEEELLSPLVVNLDIEIDGAQGLDSDQFLFNPFFAGKWEENPFRSNERLYPVDFGAPLEQTFILTLEYPETMAPVDLPSTIALALPNAGGKYMFNVKTMGNKLSMNNILQINRPVFSAAEYHYVKELFARVVTNQQTDLYFKKK